MFLLDTHVLLWTLDDIDELSPVALEIVRKNRNICVSIASFWEIAIKKSIGKLELCRTMTELEEACNSMSLEILPILPVQLNRIQDLPKIHRDPFDRLLIAQALENDLTIITKDKNIQKYDVKTLW